VRPISASENVSADEHRQRSLTSTASSLPVRGVVSPVTAAFSSRWKRSPREPDCLRPEEATLGPAVTAGADLPSLSYGHLVGDSTGPATRGRCAPEHQRSLLSPLGRSDPYQSVRGDADVGPDRPGGSERSASWPADSARACKHRPTLAPACAMREERSSRLPRSDVLGERCADECLPRIAGLPADHR
jgi:hypothetical protein